MKKQVAIKKNKGSILQYPAPKLRMLKLGQN